MVSVKSAMSRQYLVKIKINMKLASVNFLKKSIRLSAFQVTIPLILSFTLGTAIRYSFNLANSLPTLGMWLISSTDPHVKFYIKWIPHAFFSQSIWILITLPLTKFLSCDKATERACITHLASE